MRKRILVCISLFGIFALSTAQQKKISLEEIWGGEFRTESMDVLRSMDDGKHYTVLNRSGSPRTSSLDQYDYRTLEKVGTLVASSSTIPYFTSYSFSDDESKVLLATQVESIFRRSTLGIYYVYDLVSTELVRISEEKIQEPTLSPDGSQVAYVSVNNLYVMDLAGKTHRQLTEDGAKGSIINGVTDWVYEEEFGFVRAFAWNSDGSKIAFLRFDETLVPLFSMDVYGSGLYPTQHEFKYPKAGEANSLVSLHMVDMASGAITAVDLGNPYYIPRIKWMNDPNRLSVQTLNRHQNELNLLAVHAGDNSVTLLMEERDDAYVDIDDDLTFLADDSFIWTSEADGFNHLYLYGRDGKLKNQITKGPWEVTRYYGYDQKNDRIFYQSVENGSINRDIYSCSTKGSKKKRLSTLQGRNSAAFSADHTYYINTFSSATTPPAYTLHRASDGKMLKAIKDNSALLEKLKGYEVSFKEFSTLEINGNPLNMWMIKP